MPFEFGDLVLVPFPLSNQSASKKRPAVVVNSGAYSAARPDIVVMAVTSQIRATAFGEVPVHEWSIAGLLKQSVIKPVFATLEQSLVLRQLDTLSATDKTALTRAIHELLA